MDANKEWPSILEFQTGETVTVRLVEQRYRQLAKKYHPDAGGSDDDMQQLNLSKALALKWIENERNRQEQVRRVAAQVAVAQRGMQDLQNSYAYQQQQMQRWANSMYQNAYNSVNAYQNAGQQRADDHQQAEKTEPKSPEPKLNWWKRMFNRQRYSD